MMELYRFAHKEYKDDLDGEGARLFGGRWNSVGIAALYTSATVSLALLEILAHHIKYEELEDQFIITLYIPKTSTIKEIVLSKLKNDWKEDIEHTQFIGDAFLKGGKHLLLKVPSVVVPSESNYVINPNHPEHKKISIVTSTPFAFDSRIFQEQH